MRFSPFSARRNVMLKLQRRRAILILTALLASAAGVGVGTLVRFQWLDSNPSKSSNLQTHFLNPQQDFPPLADWPPATPVASDGLGVSEPAGVVTTHHDYLPARTAAEARPAETTQRQVAPVSQTAPTNTALNSLESASAGDTEAAEANPDQELSAETQSEAGSVVPPQTQAPTPTLSSILDNDHSPATETNLARPEVAAPAPRSVPVAPPIILQTDTTKATPSLRTTESHSSPSVGPTVDGHAGETVSPL